LGSGRSAVHWAVVNNNMEVLNLMLSHPSLTAFTLNQKENLFGATPVMWATMYGRLEALALLAADLRVDLSIPNKWESLEERARSSSEPETLKVLDEAKKKREEKRRWLIREQQREVSKVLLDGLYDPDSPISKLFGIRTEIIGEIIWQKMLVENWQIFPGQ